MRKDVKRSLILWPGMAAIVVAMTSSYSIVQDIRQCIGPDAESLAIATQPSFDFAVATITDVELSSRGEHGRRAMLLPQRVADVLGVVIDTSANDSPVPKQEQSIETGIEIGIELGIELGTPATVMPDSTRVLAKPEFTDLQQRSHTPASIANLHDLGLDAPALDLRKPASEDRSTTIRVAGWPSTGQLNAQLRSLSSSTTVSRSDRYRDQLVSVSNATNDVNHWTARVSSTLQQLQGLPRLGDDGAKSLIERLEHLATEGADNAEKISDRELQIRWLQATHSLTRRVAVWWPVWRLASQNAQPNTEPESKSIFAIAMKPERTNSVYSTIGRVREILPESGDASGWDRYLLLNQIAEAADADDANQRTVVAQQFLSRLQRRGLHPLHQEWLKRDSIAALRLAIQPWARGIVDYSDLLSRIEDLESNAADSSSVEIAKAMRLLKFATNPTAVDVAESIDTHYRNANFRIAISQSMLQRLVPDVPSQSVPVRTWALGARVRGTSNIDSNMKILLVPSPDRWSLKLQTIGQVETRATGVRGPVSVRTLGKSEFTTTTPIQLSPHGIDVGKSVATVHGGTRLRGIQTDYDRWPLVGDLIRGAAAKRFDSLSSQANRLSNQKIATELENQVDTQLNQQVGKTSKRLANTILGPLHRLQLDPAVAQLQTTEDRLVVRYRLAGNDQLAAYTPRPRALSSSLVSVQVHQSVINNTLERLVPTTEPMMIRDAIAGTLNTFVENEISVPNDIPSDVTVQFASSRPITVEFKDNTLWVTLRVVQLRRGDRLNLTKFIVTATYRPEVNGMDARLVRDGHLRISGPGMSMRERLPIRAIFNKVLSPNRSFPLTPPAISEHKGMEGLVVSQLELRDGWIAMAIAAEPADRIATAKTRNK